MADYDFDSLIAGYRPPREVASGIDASVTLDPASAAKSMKLSQDSGIPAEVINSDPKGYENIILQDKNRRVFEENDKIAKFVSDNPTVAPVIKDDYENLNVFSRALQGLQTGWKRGGLGEAQGDIMLSRRFGSASQTDVEQVNNQLKELADPIGVVDRISQGLGAFGGQIGYHTGEIFAGAALGSAVPGIGTTVGGIAGLSAGLGRTSAARNYYSTEGMTSSDGQPLPESTRLGLALVVGSLNAGAGMITAGSGATAASNLIQAGVREAAQNPTVVKALGNAVAEAAKGTATFSATMGSLEALTGVATDIAKTVSPGQWETIYNDPVKRQQFSTSIAHAMTEAAELGLALHLPGAGVSFVADSMRIRQAQNHVEQLKAAENAAADTFVKGRSEDTLRQLIESHSDNQALGIPVEIIDKHLATDPRAFDFIPEVATQLDHARASGGDVEISLARYLAHAPDPLKEAIRDDLRFHPEGFTANEAKEIEKAWVAYHGTAASFDKFDSKWRLTGEGANVYGAGHYVAERKGIAESYYEQLAEKEYFVGGERLDETNPAHVAAQYLDKHLDNAKDAVEDLRRDIQMQELYQTQHDVSGGTPSALQEAMRAAITHIEEGKPVAPMSEKLTGNFYQVHVKADPERMLHWDKPFDEQTPEVQTALKSMGIRDGNELYQQIHQGAMNEATMVGGERSLEEAGHRVAAQKMRDAGLHGVQYFDAASRNEGEGRTHNLVIFHDDHLEITHRNGEPVTPIALEVMNEAAKERKALWLDPLLRPEGGKPPLGMTEAQYARYSNLLEKLQASIELKAEKRAEAEVAHRLKPEWKELEEATRNEVSFGLRREPAIAADFYFRRGELSDGTVPKDARFKLDAAAVEAILGSKDQLPKGYVIDKGGIHPDEIAPLFGYQSGQKMLQDLMGLHRERELLGETSRDQFNRRVADETARRMEERHGKLDEVIQQGALDMVVGRAQTEVLGAELEALGGKETLIDSAAVEAAAHQTFAGMPLSKARDHKGFLAQIARAGKKAEDALLKGDIEAAFKAKQEQFVSHIMAQGAKAADRQFQALAATFDRFKEKTLAAVDQAYTDQIHAIMLDFGLPLKRDPAELERALVGQPLIRFIEGKESLGAEIPVARFLVDPTESQPTFKVDNVGGRPEFTMEQFLAFKDSIDTLAHNGRNEKKLRVLNEVMDLAEAVTEAQVNMDSLKQRYLPRDPNLLRRIQSRAYRWDASLLKVEQLLDWLDLDDPHGVFNRVVFRPLAEAKNREFDMRREYVQYLKDIKSDPKWWKSLDQKIEETRFTDWKTGEVMNLMRRDMFGLLLHMGSESNFDKLTRPFKDENHNLVQQFEPSALMDFVQKHVTKADLDAAQAIWNMHEKLFPMADEMSRRISGVGLDKIQARPLKITVDGEELSYRGGYVPVEADMRWIGQRESGKGMFNAADYYRATPPKGYTQSRTEAAYPISFDFNSIHRMLNEAIHDITHREALMNADKFLRQTEVRRGIVNSFGPEYMEQIPKWLDYVAYGKEVNAVSVAAINDVARWAYPRLVATQMMYRASTAMRHGVAALLDSIGETKFALPDAFREVYMNQNPAEKIRWIMEQSAELRNRNKNWDRDIRYTIEKYEGKDGPWAWYMHNGGIATGTIDMGSALPTWLVGYKRAIAEGREHADAVYEGDKLVRKAHGSAGAMDLAPVQRAGDLAKVFTVAYSFFNHSYNRLRNIGRETNLGIQAAMDREGAEAFGHFGRAAWGSLWYLVMMGALEHYLKTSHPKPAPEDEGKPESWAHFIGMGAAEQAIGTLPSPIREAGVAWLQGKKNLKDQAFTVPALQLANSFYLTGQNVKKLYQGEEASKTWVREAFNTAGYAFALPGFGQLGASAQFLADRKAGRQEVEKTGIFSNMAMKPGTFTRGLLLGRADPDQH